MIIKNNQTSVLHQHEPANCYGDYENITLKIMIKIHFSTWKQQQQLMEFRAE